MRALLVFFCFALCGLSACGGDAAGAEGSAAPRGVPFEVRRGAEGLTFTYFDGNGVHVVTSVDDVPEDRREHVRVNSLRIPPEQRLATAHLYVANLTTPNEDGTFPVEITTRREFDRLVDMATGANPNLAEATPPAPVDAPSADGDRPVVIYGASWCGACRASARFLREQGVPFVERDIEREPGARVEMMRVASEAGVQPSGIPVIDFRGTVLTGFNEPAMRRLIARAN